MYVASLIRKESLLYLDFQCMTEKVVFKLYKMEIQPEMF